MQLTVEPIENKDAFFFPNRALFSKLNLSYTNLAQKFYDF